MALLKRGQEWFALEEQRLDCDLGGEESDHRLRQFWPRACYVNLEDFA